MSIELVLTHLDAALLPWLSVGQTGLVFVRVFFLAPLAVALAWLFFMAFERPFLTSTRNAGH